MQQLKPIPIPCVSLALSGEDSTNLHGTVEPGRAASCVDSVIHMRRFTSPRRIDHPGPSDEQLRTFLLAALAAPDHGKLKPWRFVAVPAGERQTLAEAFIQIHEAREPRASSQDLERAREKAYRAPTLLLAIARLGVDSVNIPRDDILISLGCAIQNMLLSATAAGFATALTSGRSMQSPILHRLFDLLADEVAVSFISIGTKPGYLSGKTRALDLSHRFATLGEKLPGPQDVLQSKQSTGHAP